MLVAARRAMVHERFDDGTRRAWTAAGVARLGSFGELELGARRLAAAGLLMDGKWEDAVVELSGLVTELDGPMGDLVAPELGSDIHLLYVHAAAQVVPALGDVMAVVDEGEAYCRRRGLGSHVVKFERARGEVLVQRREFARALVVAQRALWWRRVAWNGEECGWEASYVEVIAEALAGLGRVREALEAVDAELPSVLEPRLCVLRADLLAGAGRWREAVGEYDQVVALNATHHVLLHRAIACWALGERGRAREDVWHASALRPDDVTHALWLAAMGDGTALRDARVDGEWPGWLVRFARGEITAGELLREARQRPYAEPYLAQAWVQVGIAEQRAGRRCAAEAAYRRARTRRRTAVSLWAAGALGARVL
jgi:tetratricopeptide (TPR) repeat protein